jgi:hypothetical protein
MTFAIAVNSQFMPDVGTGKYAAANIFSLLD